jgi:outer membrane protein
MKTHAFPAALAWVLLTAFAVAQQPASNDASLSGVSVGGQSGLQSQTFLSVEATNLPSGSDQSVQGTSVAPSLATNPPASPSGLNAGTNALTNLPAVPDTSGLPQAPMITNPVTPGSLSAPLPTTATGPITMPTAGTNAFGLKISVKDIPLTAEALAKAGNKVIPGVIAPNARKLTIDDCVQIALTNNPTILTNIASIRQASGAYITQRAGLLPQVGVVAPSAYQYTYGNVNQGLGSISTHRHDTDFQTWNVQLQGSQLLFDGWKTPSLTAAAKINEQIAYFTLRQSIDSVIAQVVQQFYTVVLDRALVIANEQQVALYQTQVTDQQSRYDAGTVPRFNVLQAQVQLANAMPPLIQAKNNLRISLFTLVQLIGLNYPNLQNVEIPFDVVGVLDYKPIKADSNASIHTALLRNPQLKAQRLSILAAAKQITAAIAGWMPTVNATGGYQLDGYMGSKINENLRGWFVGGSFNWAIWDGLATYGNVKQAKATMSSYKTTYDNGVRQVILQVQQAISNLKQASETIDSQKATVEQSVEALRLARERLDAGAGVQLDVINAQVQLLQAQTNVLQALFNYISAKAQYEQALSLNTEYEELFDDPMTPNEKRRYKDLISSDRRSPALPRSLRASDPLPPSTTFDDTVKSSRYRQKEKASAKTQD